MNVGRPNRGVARPGLARARYGYLDKATNAKTDGRERFRAEINSPPPKRPSEEGYDPLNDERQVDFKRDDSSKDFKERRGSLGSTGSTEATAADKRVDHESQRSYRVRQRKRREKPNRDDNIEIVFRREFSPRLREDDFQYGPVALGPSVSNEFDIVEMEFIGEFDTPPAELPIPVHRPQEKAKRLMVPVTAPPPTSEGALGRKAWPKRPVRKAMFARDGFRRVPISGYDGGRRLTQLVGEPTLNRPFGGKRGPGPWERWMEDRRQMKHMGLEKGYGTDHKFDDSPLKLLLDYPTPPCLLSSCCEAPRQPLVITPPTPEPACGSLCCAPNPAPRNGDTTERRLRSIRALNKEHERVRSIYNLLHKHQVDDWKKKIEMKRRAEKKRLADVEPFQVFTPPNQHGCCYML